MGYFDQLAEAAFKTSDDGEIIYYPNGVLTKGRVIPDQETRDKAFKLQRKILKVSMFIGIRDNCY